MKNFQLIPQIHSFEDFESFAKEFQVGESDLILTNEIIYESSMKAVNLPAAYLFQERYGTGEPNDGMVNAILEAMPREGIARVIAIGGGTIIDISKFLIFKDTKTVADLYDNKDRLKRDKQLVIVPTTAGTGSEVTNISILEFREKQVKIGLADDRLCADYAVLIPSLLKGLPFRFFMASAIDALIHAVESYVSPKSNPFTEVFAIKAIEKLIAGFQSLNEKGENHRLAILEQFSFASTFAGIAFSNTGVGAVHAMSYPLGGKYHVPHGEANYAMFTEVFKLYNKKDPEGKIKEINQLLAAVLGVEQSGVYEALEKLLDRLIKRKPLREYGMQESDIEDFANSVIAFQQRLLNNNYVPFDREDFIGIYARLY